MLRSPGQMRSVAMHFGTFVALLLMVACDDDGPTATEPPGSSNPPVHGRSIQVREGDFLPPGFDFSVVARKADAAGAAEGRLPQFEGEVNGIQVQVPRSGTFGMPVQMCSSENFGLVNDLEIDYLPPGTYEHSPQFKGVCADGATAFVMQSFETRFATFEIIYIPGRDHIDASVPAHRVVPDTFDGIDGVMVQPVIEEGFGPSTAAVKLDDGLLFLQAENLPLEQSRLIMNGLKCSSC